MLEADGLVGLLLVALWIHAIIDVVRADESQIRHLPKQTWLLIVMSLPDVGALIWMVAGKPEKAVRQVVAENTPSTPLWSRRPIGPEDKPDYVAWLHETTARRRPDGEGDGNGEGGSTDS